MDNQNKLEYAMKTTYSVFYLAAQLFMSLRYNAASPRTTERSNCKTHFRNKWKKNEKNTSIMYGTNAVIVQYVGKFEKGEM